MLEILQCTALANHKPKEELKKVTFEKKKKLEKMEWQVKAIYNVEKNLS